MIGNGPWSSLAYVVASTYPQSPPTPTYTFVDNTHVDLLLAETSNDGGSPILAYYLYINEGQDGSSFHEVTTYDHQSLVFTVTVGESFDTMTVTSGLTYTFKYVAENIIGRSDDSNQL